jgi:predicted CXXCH cytochrome family protein
MRRLTLWALTFCGLGLLLCGVSLLLFGTPAYAQDVDLDDAEYVGARECASCHRARLRDHGESRHALTLQDVSRDEDLILGDFEQGEDVRTVQFPDDEVRPFDADDIAYAVGTGRNIQRYLYEVDRNEFMLLPAQWNVNTQSWEPYTLAEEWPGDAYAFGPNCAGCHTTGIDTRRFRWEDDGVQCESCHGPGSLHVEAADDDEDLEVIRASIVLNPDPQICGQCHSQGTEPEDSLPYPAEYRPGQADLLDEDVFVLVPPDDSAHWYPSGHANQKYMQYNESLLSAHSTALASMLESEFADDSCLQCHSGDYGFMQRLIARYEDGDREGDPPESLTTETAQFGIVCTSCHNPHSEGDFPANLWNDTYTLCTDCHSNPSEGDFIHHPSREMFEGITLVSVIEGVSSAHFTEDEGPRCATCHMPDVPVESAGVRNSHRWTPILPGSAEALQDSCTTCHTDFVDVAGMQQLVEDIQMSTRARLEAAQAALTDGSPEWVSAALQFVEGDGSLGIHNYPYTEALLKAAEGEIGLAPTPIAEADVGALLNVTPPPADTVQTEPFTGEIGGGLTAPSLILLGIAGLVIAVAAYAFLFRRPQ